MFRILVLLLTVSSSAHFACAFKPNLPPVKDTQVLVVGANGRVGEQVRALLEEHPMCVQWSLGCTPCLLWFAAHPWWLRELGCSISGLFIGTLILDILLQMWVLEKHRRI